ALGGMALFQAGVVVTLTQGDGQQGSVGPETPGMIGAAEELSGVAVSLGCDARPLVGATIVQNPHGAVAMTHHQHRLGPDPGSEIISRVGDLTVVADVNPGVAEHVLHFEREHLLVDIDVAMNLGLAHERLYGFDVTALSGHRCLLPDPLSTREPPAAPRPHGADCLCCG